MQHIIGTSRNLVELHFKQMVLNVRGLSRLQFILTAPDSSSHKEKI